MRQRILDIIVVLSVVSALVMSVLYYRENTDLKDARFENQNLTYQLTNAESKTQSLENALKDEKDKRIQLLEDQQRLSQGLVKAIKDEKDKRIQLLEDQRVLSQGLVKAIKEKEQTENYLLQMSRRNNKDNPYRVVPIYFYPKDLTINPLYPAIIDASLAVIQAWYSKQLNGPTFEWDSTVTVRGQRNLEEYRKDGKNDWNPVFYDLYNLGIYGGEKRIILLFVQGFGDFAGGNHLLAAVGDWALRGISDEYYVEEWQDKDSQRGTIAHELGHALDLGHPSPLNSSTVMENWGDFPNVGLSNEEVQMLLNNPFIK